MGHHEVPGKNRVDWFSAKQNNWNLFLTQRLKAPPSSSNFRDTRKQIWIFNRQIIGQILINDVVIKKFVYHPQV